MKAQCGIGARVSLVAQHWLRPYEAGIVVDQQRQALKKWLVQFEFGYPGGGIEGNKIWCDENDFAEVLPAGEAVTLRSQVRDDYPLNGSSYASMDIGDGVNGQG